MRLNGKNALMLGAVALGGYYLYTKWREKQNESLVSGLAGGSVGSALTGMGAQALNTPAASSGFATGLLSSTGAIGAFIQSLMGIAQTRTTTGDPAVDMRKTIQEALKSPQYSGEQTNLLNYLNDYTLKATGTPNAFSLTKQTTSKRTYNAGAPTFGSEPGKFYTTGSTVLTPNKALDAVTAQRMTEIVGIQSGLGLASMKSGGVLLAPQPVYQPSSVSFVGSTIRANTSIPTALATGLM